MTDHDTATVSPAALRDASRVTTVLSALLTAEREVIAAARAARAIEDEDVRDALVSTLLAQVRALNTLRYQISEI